LRQHGVRVAALCPGTTATDFFDANEAQTMLRLAGSQVRTAQDVVETALKALDDDKASVVDGRLNRAMVGLNRLIPAHWLAKTVGKAMQADFEKRGV
jgi:short-subunit dehydrogenase